MSLAPEALEKNFGVEFKTPCGYLSSSVQLASWVTWVKGIQVATEGWNVFSQSQAKVAIEHIGRLGGRLGLAKKNPHFAQFFFRTSQSRSTLFVILANHPKC